MYGIKTPSIWRVLKCPTCTKVVIYNWGGKRKRVYCSIGCRQSEQQAPQFAPSTSKCDECGNSFEQRFSFQRFCCNKCRHDYRNKRPECRAELLRRIKEYLRTPAGKAKALHRRLRRKKKVAVGEDVISTDVFSRDRWRCQLCGCKVIPSASTYIPNRATLDHIVPLSRGGTHTYANVQTACNLCNSKKSAKTVGQFRLF